MSVSVALDSSVYVCILEKSIFASSSLKLKFILGLRINTIFPLKCHTTLDNFLVTYNVIKCYLPILLCLNLHYIYYFVYIKNILK